MARPRKRARRTDDEEAQLQAPAVAPAPPATGLDATENSGSALETLPDAVLERIFAEFLGAAESWRTARRASRRLRSVVGGMEWSELRFSTSRADALEALSAVVRSGKLRLRRGVAAVDLELVYPASDEPITRERCHAEVETHELSRAACDVLRSATAAAGGLQEARVRSLGGIFNSNDFAKDAHRMLRTHTVNVLLALQPHAHGTSSAAASTLRSVSIGGDNCCPMESNHIFSRLPSVRRALAHFSSLQSLSLPFWWAFDHHGAAIVAESCPQLRSLLIALVEDEAFPKLSPLPLEELRLWNDEEYVIEYSDGFIAFAEGPAGRTLRLLGDATRAEGAKLFFSPDALRAFARLPRLERTDFQQGLCIGWECGREEAAFVVGPPKLRELQVCVQLTSLAPGRGARERLLGVVDGIARAGSLARLDLHICVLGRPLPAGAARDVRALLEAATVPLSSVTVFFNVDEELKSSLESRTNYHDEIDRELKAMKRETESCFRAAGPLGAALVDGGWRWRRSQV
eukprot:tig00020675_g12587.t1